jgi:hypothetical protein
MLGTFYAFILKIKKASGSVMSTSSFVIGTTYAFEFISLSVLLYTFNRTKEIKYGKFQLLATFIPNSLPLEIQYSLICFSLGFSFHFNLGI